jgi:hypothetical protein
MRAATKYVTLMLLAIGLLGHLLAANAMGGGRTQYTHHIIGFFIILIVVAVLLWAIGWLFWKNRPHITVMLIATVQAILGLLVYFNTTE